MSSASLISRERIPLHHLRRLAASLVASLAMTLWPVRAAAEDNADVRVELQYIGEAWGNVRGGLRTGSAYLDSLEVAAEIDADAALGWPGTRFAVSAAYSNQQTLSDRIVGDMHTVSNIDADAGLRLYEAWAEKSFGGASIKLGLVDLGSEFDANETGALFINGAHGTGLDLSQVGENGPSLFPVPGLGALARVRLAPDWLVKAGVFEGVPGDPDRPRHFSLRLEEGEGALTIGEIEYRKSGHLTIGLGAWRHSNHRRAKILPGRASTGAYARIEAKIASAGKHQVHGFGRFGIADPSVHQLQGYLGAGITLSGPLFADKDAQEKVGLAVGIARNGRRFLKEQQSADVPYDRHELTLELTYRIEAASWLAVQPDIQYIVNPGMNPGLGDAMVVGLRFHATLGRDF